MTEYEQRSLALLQLIAHGIEIQLSVTATQYRPDATDLISAEQRTKSVNNAIMKYVEDLASLNQSLGAAKK